ncbi:HIT domain-containing protein [Enterobacteriaceae bacterium H18W14]|uniref:HIT family protein n=1 Tax=Dryocola boscaweniae TaxID=2925397 RepID=UPI0022F0D700|nr:HIT domain-containing protein [Dryocola boscaweniae]MCT4715619.1 HIT domain-containing protein [Dryocola boscaweniae]
MKNKFSLILPDNTECAFCRYLNGEIPYTIVMKDKHIAVMVTKEQRGYPHLLVIPTRHCETILQLSDTECSKLLKVLRDVSIAIEKEYNVEGISVWQNNGISSNQTINHLHFHVAGTTKNQGTIWGEVEESSLSITEGISKKILNSLK